MHRLIGHLIIPFSLLFLFTFRFNAALCQNRNSDSTAAYNRSRLTLAVLGGSMLYTGTFVGLYTLWYEQNHHAAFHLFNDNAEWMQIDKFGHAFTSYMIGKGGIRALSWTGIDRKKAVWYGGLYGFVFLSTFEVLDGLYEEWGASPVDLAANAFGTTALISQELAFGHQVMTMKFSYHPTPLYQYRPELLGSEPTERIIKDYNGQTYWFSFNYRSIFKDHTVVPGWINLAGGYAAYGLLGGHRNPDRYSDIERYRRYFIALDVDFEKIKTNSKFLNSFFFFLNLFKFPLPALEFNGKGQLLVHPLYF